MFHKKMMLNNKSLTLVELIIACILLGLAVLGITAAMLFVVEQVTANIDRQQANAQIDFLFEDMKLRCASANQIVTFIDPGGTLNSLTFRGERNVHVVDPDEEATTGVGATKYYYTYAVSGAGDIVLWSCTGSPCDASNAISEQTLVSRKLNPQLHPDTELVDAPFLVFTHHEYTATLDDMSSEPNFISVTVNANCRRAPIGTSKRITKSDGIRFWFVDVVGG